MHSFISSRILLMQAILIMYQPFCFHFPLSPPTLSLCVYVSFFVFSLFQTWIYIPTNCIPICYPLRLQSIPESNAGFFSKYYRCLFLFFPFFTSQPPFSPMADKLSIFLRRSFAKLLPDSHPPHRLPFPTSRASNFNNGRCRILIR